MGSLVDELHRREAAARAEAEELRGRIAQLAERLAGVEERLSRLVIARETVDEVLSEAGADVSPSAEPEVTGPPGPGHPPVTGALAVPPWRAGLEASVLPQAYRDLLEVAEDAGRPLRAAQIAAAAGLSTDKAKVETLRSKLKRLVERGWLAGEAGPGLFALPARAGACRHLIGDRLDITGARWGLDGAEAVLTLRAVISNGDFDEYWRFHLAREHQRLYPGTAQGNYTLGA